MRGKSSRWENSIQSKLLVHFAVLVLIFSGSMFLLYSISMKNIYRLTSESVTNSLSQINVDTNRILTDAQKIAENVATDTDIQKSLRKPLPSTEKEIYKERLNFNNALYYTMRNAEIVDGVYVVGDNGAIYRSYYGLQQDGYRNEVWYKNTVTARRALWMEPHEGSTIARNLNHLTISIVVPIQDKASTNILGVVVVDVLMEELEAIAKAEIVYDGDSFILNEKNKIIYTNNKDMSSEMIQTINEELLNDAQFKANKTQEVLIGKQKYLVGMIGLSDSTWKIMGLISYDEMFKDAKVLRNIIILLMGVSIIIALVLAIVASRNIANPISNVLLNMKKVEKGDFSIRMQEIRVDEIGDLIHGFNHMVYKVDELMEKERAVQQKLTKSEFNALQAQINPHFLYNTLDSINWMARINRTDKVEEMIDSLTQFLRIGLSRGRVFITLEEEIKHVESYMAIQKIRYDRILDYEIIISNHLTKYEVIKMILHPLVENALYHGIKEKDDHGTIYITAEETQDKLILCVSDDGIGMKQIRLEEIRKMLLDKEDYHEGAYGIINVQRRIRAYFGEEYGVSLNSEPEKGTQAYITIPKREVNKND